MDVVTRLIRRKLFPLDSLQVLQERLGIHQIDPRLRSLTWAARPSARSRRGRDPPACQSGAGRGRGLAGAPETPGARRSPARPAGGAGVDHHGRRGRGSGETPRTERIGRLSEPARRGAGGPCAAYRRVGRRGRGGHPPTRGSRPRQRGRGPPGWSAICSSLPIEPRTPMPRGLPASSRLCGSAARPCRPRPAGLAEAAGELVRRRLGTGGEAAVSPWLSKAQRLLGELRIENWPRSAAPGSSLPSAGP